MIGPCVASPQKIICIGLNYRQHAFESGMAMPAVPVVFTKYNNTLVNFGGDVPLGKAGHQFDYEVEWAKAWIIFYLWANTWVAADEVGDLQRLRPGDVVEVEIERLGVTRNKMIQ